MYSSYVLLTAVGNGERSAGLTVPDGVSGGIPESRMRDRRDCAAGLRWRGQRGEEGGADFPAGDAGCVLFVVICAQMHLY